MMFSKEQPPNDIGDALAALREADLVQGQAEQDLLQREQQEIEQQMEDAATDAATEPPPPVYNAVTSSAWRLLEEQRSHALDIVREAEIEIAKWTERRDDAQRAAEGCLAGQTAMER